VTWQHDPCRPRLSPTSRKRVNHVAVDREQQIPLLQALAAGEPPTMRTTVSAWRRVGACCARPLRPACGRPISPHSPVTAPELGLERVQWALVAHAIEHIGHQAIGTPRRILRQLATAS